MTTFLIIYSFRGCYGLTHNRSMTYRAPDLAFAKIWATRVIQMQIGESETILSHTVVAA